MKNQHSKLVGMGKLSFKYKLISIIWLTTCLAFGFVYWSYQNTIFSYEKNIKLEKSQAIKNQFLKLVESHNERLITWLTPWFNSNTTKLDAELDFMAWESSLINLKNEMQNSLGIVQINSYTKQLDMLYQFLAAQEDAPILQENNELVNLLDEASYNETPSWHVALNKDLTPYILTIIPSEDRDGIITHFHLVVSEFRPILEELNQLTNSFNSMVLSRAMISSHSEPFVKSEDNIYFKNSKNEQFIRTATLIDSYQFDSAIFLETFSPMSPLSIFHKESQFDLFMTLSIALFFYIVLSLIIAKFMSPLTKIQNLALNIKRGITNQSLELNTSKEFNTITEAYKLLLNRLEKTEKLKESVLGHIEQAIFIVNKDGNLKILNQEVFNKVFPSNTNVETIFRFFESISQFDDPQLRATIDCIWDTSTFIHSTEGLFSQLPSELKTFKIEGEQRAPIKISLDYKLIYSDGIPSFILVSARDITKIEQALNESNSRKERIRRISTAANHIEAYAQCFEAVVYLFKRIDTAVSKKFKDCDMNLFIRQITALRDYLMALEYVDLATSINNLYEKLEETFLLNSNLDSLIRDWEKIKDQWKFEYTDVHQVLNLLHYNDTVLLNREKIELLSNIMNLENEKTISFNLAKKTTHILAPRELLIFNMKICSRLATSLEKKIEFEFFADSQAVNFRDFPDYQILILDLMKIHTHYSIESSGFRQKSSKSPEAKIAFGLYTKGQNFHIILKDDGQGFSDNNKVEQRDSYLASIESYVQKLGGQISIYNSPGTGLQFEIDLPMTTIKIEKKTKSESTAA